MCPNCGGPVFLNVRGGDWFIEEPYMKQADRYQSWLKKNSNKRLLVIDIGSGFNTPVWIRWPSEQLVYKNDKANLIRINPYHPQVPEEISNRSTSFALGAMEVISAVWDVFSIS